MSLARITRAFAVAAPRTQMTFARCMSTDIHKKESGMEKDFVAKAEREALKSLVRKMEAEADPGNAKALKALEDKLSASGVRVTEQMKKDLLAWRHTSH